jgi:flagellar biosynthesis/type III secretory pathway protein FliH
MAPTTRDGKDAMTVESYRPSEYTEATWPVVSDVKESAQFIPSSFDRVAESVHAVDGMFADFGSASQDAIELSREAGDFDLQPVIDVAIESGSMVPDISDTQPHDTIDFGAIDTTREIVLDEQESQVNSALHGEPEEQAHSMPVDAAGDGEVSQGKSISIDEVSLESALRESYERGSADARREVTVVQEQLEERYRLLWEDMQTQLEESLRVNETRAVDLALRAAKRLIGDVVEQQRDYIHHVIREAIKVSAGAEISAIRVSPGDYDFLKLADYGDSKKFLSGTGLKFISDESIRAGCVLVTSAGEVDYDLDGAWERMRSKVQQEPES